METYKYRIVSGLMSVAKKHKEKLMYRNKDDLQQFFFHLSLILLMEEILHHLGCKKGCVFFASVTHVFCDGG